MIDQQERATARIIVGTSPVGVDHRHAYLLFERSDGSQTVLRGGPSVQPEGNALSNFAGSTVLGSRNYGSIRFDYGPYASSYDAVRKVQSDGSARTVPLAGSDPDDPSIERDEIGNVIVHHVVAFDWPRLGETHERAAVWEGTDRELDEKLNAAMEAGQQIHDAELEYSPLYNNSNGVAGMLLRAADAPLELPKTLDGTPVDAPNFGDTLRQHVGPASSRSGYWFDGKQWHDGDNRKIAPPNSANSIIPLEAVEAVEPVAGSLRISQEIEQHEGTGMPAGSGMRDPELDRLAEALFSDDDDLMLEVATHLETSADVQALLRHGQELAASQLQDIARQGETRDESNNPRMRM